MTIETVIEWAKGGPEYRDIVASFEAWKGGQ